MILGALERMGSCYLKVLGFSSTGWKEIWSLNCAQYENTSHCCTIHLKYLGWMFYVVHKHKTLKTEIKYPACILPFDFSYPFPFCLVLILLFWKAGIAISEMKIPAWNTTLYFITYFKDKNTLKARTYLTLCSHLFKEHGVFNRRHSVSKCPMEHTFLYEFTFNHQIQSYSTSSSNYPAWASKKERRGDGEERGMGDIERGREGERVYCNLMDSDSTLYIKYSSQL